MNSCDHLVLRTPGGEMSFTGGEYDMAMDFAKKAAMRGRAVLIAYTYREKDKQKISTKVIWDSRAQIRKVFEEPRTAVA